MGTWDFNKIKRWTFFIFSTWALLAFIAWHYESTCGMFLSGDCWAQHWDGARHVVLLRWMKEYQTLAAGVLAFCGGSGVLIATRMSIDASTKAENIRNKKLVKLACRTAANELKVVSSMFYRHSTEHTLTEAERRHPFKNTISMLSILYSTNSFIGECVSDRISRLPKLTTPSYSGTWEEYRRLCRNTAEMLRLTEDYLRDDGTVSTDTLLDIPDFDITECISIYQSV